MRILALLSLVLWAGVASANGTGIDAPVPSAQHGATVYQSRCTLCHGNKGMGEGALPLSLPDYPATNLLEPKHGTGTEALRELIVWGGSKGAMHPYMPPWGGELTWQEIESVTKFVELLRSDTEGALAILDRASENDDASLKVGRSIYVTRCALCHGKSGEGDGKMAKIIKNPPPFDLTASRMPPDYLRMIIGDGGDGVGRSPRMPPWSGELSTADIDSVILYLETLRD